MKALLIRFVCSALFAAVLILSAGAQGREPVGNISGTVLNAHGKPVADSTVFIQTADGLHPHATRTDREGRFEFVRYETGQYDLRAYANGAFSDWDRNVVIRSKKTTEVTLHLEAQ
ncbi:MAG TPA: carboxypeptidase regulatory-like domain-containing protein [Candidatus Acidoferrum sp.]|nr:carboxypeptidase regulatory-like domain-containing protein [Candidatus Acidoferrum sp.]